MSTNTDHIPSRAQIAAMMLPELLREIPLGDFESTHDYRTMLVGAAVDYADRLLAALRPEEAHPSPIEQRLAALEAVGFAKEGAGPSFKYTFPEKFTVTDETPHNPHNVPPDNIPAGYRLARVSEIDGLWHYGWMSLNDDGSEFRFQTKSSGGSPGAWASKSSTVILRGIPSTDTIIVPITPPEKEVEVDWGKIVEAYIEAHNTASQRTHTSTAEDHLVAIKKAVAEYERQKGQQP